MPRYNKAEKNDNSHKDKRTKEKKKKHKMKYMVYSEESLKKALRAVSLGTSLRAASSKFKIPFATLRVKHKGICPIGKKSGPPTILTSAEEEKLVNWICATGEKGFSFTKDMLQDSVKILLKKLNRPNPFTDGRPGRHWFEAFLKRHPQLSAKTPQSLRGRQAQISEKNLCDWFQEVQDYLESKNLLDIDPSRIFNCNELGFFLSPKGSKVLTNKKSRSIYNLAGAKELERLTTFVIGNAAGQLLPPIIMYSYQKLPAIVIKKIPKDWNIGRSNNGWMTGESFYEYMTDTFYPWCVKNEIEFPIILYMDGQSSFITMALSDFCIEKKIELISLLSNSTHLIQPMEVALFEPLKESWKKAISNWKIENNRLEVRKADFASILKISLESIDISTILSSGFASCGLAPFSPDAINYDKNLDNSETMEEETVNENNSIDKENKKNYEFTLEMIEKTVDENILNLFICAEDTNEQWHGEEKYTELFSLWLKCRKSLKSESSIDIDNNLLEDPLAC